MLTFTIWTYSPSYDLNDTPIVDIAIAEKKTMEEVVKPYRLLYSLEEGLTGSTAIVNIEKVFNSLKSGEIQTVELLNNKASFDLVNKYITTPNRMTFFYSAEVPIEILSNILPFADHSLPDASFNRLVIDWGGPSDDEMTMFFINSTKLKVYKAQVVSVNKDGFVNRVVGQLSKLKTYSEIERPGKLSLFVTNTPEDVENYTYILEKISLEKFKNALFASPSLVRSNPVGTSGQEYTDDSVKMNDEFNSKRISYVDPAAESETPGEPAEIIHQSISFINEHNGWTDDYRYFRSNPATKQVSFQLYLSGMPVFSNDTWTEITAYWGENRVYRYIRPYYTFSNSTPIKRNTVQLPSGQATYDLISTLSGLNMASVDDIVLGYYLTQDDQQLSLNLEPSWYYLLNGSWVRVSPELLGGGNIGLE